jgi:hypothetical protein
MGSMIIDRSEAVEEGGQLPTCFLAPGTVQLRKSLLEKTA